MKLYKFVYSTQCTHEGSCWANSEQEALSFMEDFLNDGGIDDLYLSESAGELLLIEQTNEEFFCVNKREEK